MVLSKYWVLWVLFRNNHLDFPGSTTSLKHRVLAINPNDLFPSRLLLLKSRTFRNKTILPYLNFKYFKYWSSKIGQDRSKKVKMYDEFTPTQTGGVARGAGTALFVRYKLMKPFYDKPSGLHIYT